MIIVQVYVNVIEKHISDFIYATLENANSSMKEKGVIRFDFMQDREDQTKFLLTEIYENEHAPLEHKKTEHYLKWRKTVAPMMAEPRRSEKYRELFPIEKKFWKVADE